MNKVKTFCNCPIYRTINLQLNGEISGNALQLFPVDFKLAMQFVTLLLHTFLMTRFFSALFPRMFVLTGYSSSNPCCLYLPAKLNFLCWKGSWVFRSMMDVALKTNTWRYAQREFLMLACGWGVCSDPCAMSTLKLNWDWLFWRSLIEASISMKLIQRQTLLRCPFLVLDFSRCLAAEVTLLPSSLPVRLCYYFTTPWTYQWIVTHILFIALF